MFNISEHKKQQTELEKNMIFIGTIYDTFEAMEETLGKLKLEKPLFLTYLAKKAFAEEVFKHAQEPEGIYLKEDQSDKENATLQ